MYASHPIINDYSTPEQMRHRALLVALGLVYYVRLNTSYRERFTEELDRHNFSVKFQEVFTEEVHSYVYDTFIIHLFFDCRWIFIQTILFCLLE